ncbi:MAG: hypothetical protein WAU07_00120 [Microgenomates group bacterium]
MSKERHKGYVLPPSEVGDIRLLRDISVLENLRLNNKPVILGEIGDGKWLVTGSLFPTVPEKILQNGSDSPPSLATNNLVWVNEWQKEVELCELSVEDLLPAITYILNLIEAVPGSVATYAISNDPRGVTGTTRKALGTSVSHFHFHNFLGIKELITESKSSMPFRSFREPFYENFSEVMHAFMAQQVFSESIMLLSPEEKNCALEPYINFGGIAFKITETHEEISQVLSSLLLQLDNISRQFHQQFMSYFFSNYLEVKNSNWNMSYQARNIKDAIDTISFQNWIPRSSLQLLLKAAPRISRSDQECLSPDAKIFRSPTYSVGILPSSHNKENTLYLVFNPHLYAMRAGGLQTIGIEFPERIRHPHVHPVELISERQKRAELVHSKVMEKINDSVKVA